MAGEREGGKQSQRKRGERGERETERKRNLICPLFCYN